MADLPNARLGDDPRRRPASLLAALRELEAGARRADPFVAPPLPALRRAALVASGAPHPALLRKGAGALLEAASGMDERTLSRALSQLLCVCAPVRRGGLPRPPAVEDFLWPATDAFS